MSTIKKLVIFGATGNTGLATVARAIDLGFEVTAFVRDPSKLPSDLKVASVVIGDVTNQDDVDKAIKGQDAVIIALGTRTNLGPTTVMSDGTANIIASMKKFNVNRISVCISAFLFMETEKIPPIVMNIHLDHVRMEKVVKESAVEWTILCPPHIDNMDAQGNYRLAKDSRIGSNKISKHDLADSLIQVLLTDEYLRSRLGIGYQ